jgi:hypothetical protein
MAAPRSAWTARRGDPPAAVWYVRASILEVTMPEIQWRKDVDAALSEAKVARKPVLLDFSAAPM